VLLAVHEDDRHPIAVLRGKAWIVIDVELGQRAALVGENALDDKAGVVTEMAAGACEQSHSMD
jgi:hypothetical protein